MSYCRFSSDNFGCDAYVYEDCMGGFTIHLAGSKHVGDIPKVPSFNNSTPEKFMIAHKAQMDFLNTAEREKIKLEYSGETFNVETAKECAEALLRFREIGYRIPQHAIDSLLDEEEES